MATVDVRPSAPEAAAAPSPAAAPVAVPAWAWGLPLAGALAGSLAFAPEMTYAQFHVTFTLPSLALLVVATARAARLGRRIAGDLGRGDRFAVVALALHAVVAFVYTTPWDDHLVATGVWGYPPGRVLATVGHVPIEEYAFFLIQSVGTGLLLFALARALGPQPLGTLPGPRAAGWVRGIGALVLLAGASVGVLLAGTERGTYMGLIMAWALPVAALQWAFGGDLLVRRWRIVALGVLVPTLYLWVVDALAIGWSIWYIEPATTLGWRPLGLPVEEAVFFLVTNAMVVFGLVISLHPASLERLRGLVSRRRPWRPLLALWAVAMVPAPLLPDAFASLSYVATTALAAAVLVHAWRRYGAASLALFGVAFAFGVAVEAVGVATGVPFGAYAYTAPGPSLLGVPLLVPLGWWAFTMIAIAVAPAGRTLVVAPFALVAWDLGLDPLMVQQGFWAFDGGGVYLGVPPGNFVGWFVAGALLVWVLTRLEPRLLAEESLDLRIVYLVQAFLIGAGLVMFGLPLAAVVAVAAMLAVASTWWWLPPVPRS
jgi:lycopene beta-cyclase